jgi:hypothetical protein
MWPACTSKEFGSRIYEGKSTDKKIVVVFGAFLYCSYRCEFYKIAVPLVLLVLVCRGHYYFLMPTPIICTCTLLSLEVLVFVLRSTKYEVLVEGPVPQ